MLWSPQIIHDLITYAEANGESQKILSSPRHAKLFRYAINNAKRTKKIGQNLTTQIHHTTVILRKRPL